MTLYVSGPRHHPRRRSICPACAGISERLLGWAGLPKFIQSTYGKIYENYEVYYLVWVFNRSV